MLIVQLIANQFHIKLTLHASPACSLLSKPPFLALEARLQMVEAWLQTTFIEFAMASIPEEAAFFYDMEICHSNKISHRFKILLVPSCTISDAIVALYHKQ